MFTLKQVVVLALAGTTVALPWEGNYSYGHWRGPWGGQGWPQNTDNNDNTPTPTSAPAVTATVAATPIQTTAAAAPSAASSSTGTYMDIVNKWRAAGGLSQLTHNSKLEANALKTVTDGNGEMVHQLNPGSMAQVLAPGNAGNFENVYVGGWLCEIPSLPGLNGVCSSAAQGWDNSSGETGHAEILTSTQYKTIGCALADGIWGCDLGFDSP